MVNTRKRGEIAFQAGVSEPDIPYRSMPIGETSGLRC